MNLFSLKVVSLWALWILPGVVIGSDFTALAPKKKCAEVKESEVRHRRVIWILAHLVPNTSPREIAFCRLLLVLQSRLRKLQD
jgi:hypothetical protein